MMSNPKELHIASKEIVSQYGAVVVCTKQFLNLLADYGAFKSIPATKQILSDLLKSGFGEFIYQLYQNNDNDILSKCYSHRQEFLSEGKYRGDLTEYVYASILYSLGIIPNVSEPNVNNPFSADASSQPVTQKKYTAKIDLRKELEILKSEYLGTLQQIIIPEDCEDGKAAGYFSFETLTKQLIIEAKIQLICERLSISDDFCCKEKAKVLSQYDTNMSGQLNAELIKQQADFITTFSEYCNPSYTQLHGSFTVQTESKQAEIETKIQYLSKCLDLNQDWCLTQKQEFLASKRKSENRRNYLIGGCLACIAIVIVSLCICISLYISASDDRDNFNKIVALAEKEHSMGNQLKALTLYQTAENSYNAIWQKGSYKAKAHDAAKSISDKIFLARHSNITKYLETKDYVNAYILLKDLPKNIIIEGNTKYLYQHIESEIDKFLDESIEDELDGFLNKIYNKGKLSADDCNRLNKILQAQPDNYWSKILKSKINESYIK
jgi:uncharacterized protein YxeA